MIAVVSAMGKTTDELMRLSYSISQNPNRREMDMLLSTGERISMALLSMALHDLNCPSISFTGSQAGIMTDGSHLNARIESIKPIRLDEALNRKQVIVLAGFQGVDPVTKEITTLGRGGSDTSAVAIAAHFKASRCEMLKDVDGVYSGDPKTVDSPKLLKQISAPALYEMCFWGSKVLHPRSVELAQKLKVPLFIGNSDNFQLGTEVIYDKKNIKENSMLENKSILSVTSHPFVGHIEILSTDTHEGLETFNNVLSSEKLPWPQVLATKWEKGLTRIMFACDEHLFESIKNTFSNSSKARVDNENVSSVTAVVTGNLSSDLIHKLTTELKKENIHPSKILQGPMSLSFFVEPTEKDLAQKILHRCIS